MCVLARASGLCVLVALVFPSCLYTVRGGPMVWTHPDHATVVGGRASAGAGIGDDGGGFDMHIGLAGGADVLSGRGAFSGNPGIEWVRLPNPVGFRLGAQAEIRSVFGDTPGDTLGWIVPQVVAGTSYLLAPLDGGESSTLAIGLEATLGFAISMNDSARGGLAMGISVTLEWTRLNGFQLRFR